MTSFLSRVQLNGARRGGRALMGSPQAMHAAVLAAFPGRLADRAEQRVLWRLDPAVGAVNLLVVSPEKPDFTHVIEQAGWPAAPHWDVRDYDPVLDRLTLGQVWAFRLTANPTRSVPLPGGGRGKRVGHVTVEQQQDWLIRRSSTAGFEIPGGALVVRERQLDEFRRGEGRVTVARATFEGQLIVTDVPALRRVLLEGLGSAKAYGCGLMTLAPVTV